MNWKKFFAATLAIIFFAVEVQAASTWQPERKIGLINGVTQVTLQMSEPCVMTDAETHHAQTNS